MLQSAGDVDLRLLRTTVAENHANTERLVVLINYVTSEVFELFSEAENYEEAVNILK